MTFIISIHARKRMKEREISYEAIESVMWLGKKMELLGADLFTFSIEEYWLHKRSGCDLSHLIGITVKCASSSYRPGNPRIVLTVHRRVYSQAA